MNAWDAPEPTPHRRERARVGADALETFDLFGTPEPAPEVLDAPVPVALRAKQAGVVAEGEQVRVYTTTPPPIRRREPELVHIITDSPPPVRRRTPAPPPRALSYAAPADPCEVDVTEAWTLEPAEERVAGPRQPSEAAAAREPWPPVQ